MFFKGLVVINMQKHSYRCLFLFTLNGVTEEVWLSDQEISATQWEQCYYRTKHLESLLPIPQ